LFWDVLGTFQSATDIFGTFAEHVAPEDEVPFLCIKIAK
jgi:hypothetical protein